MTSNDDIVTPVGRLIADWQAARAELQAIERAEHPDITDRFGRVWTWKVNNIYVHCGIANEPDRIPHYGLPTQYALDNVNYDLCDVCVDGRERSITPCRPEWDCRHAVCARLRSEGERS